MADDSQVERDALQRLAAFARRPRAARPDVASFDATDLPAPARDAARLVWTRRIANEALSVAIARALRATAGQLGAGAVVDDALARLEDDEIAHVEVAEAMLARLGTVAEHTSAVDAPVTPPGSASERWFRQVLTALCVCEVVSAQRFAAVRSHTDLAIPRACIEMFLRDETAHGELGFALLPLAVSRLADEAGRAGVASIAANELRTALRALDWVVGLDAERRGGLPPSRPQPTPNPGVVEPAVDAAAFYDAVERTIVPRLERLGLPARAAWRERWGS